MNVELSVLFFDQIINYVYNSRYVRSHKHFDLRPRKQQQIYKYQKQKKNLP